MESLVIALNDPLLDEALRTMARQNEVSLVYLSLLNFGTARLLIVSSDRDLLSLGLDENENLKIHDINKSLTFVSHKSLELQVLDIGIQYNRDARRFEFYLQKTTRMNFAYELGHFLLTNRL